MQSHDRHEAVVKLLAAVSNEAGMIVADCRSLSFLAGSAFLLSILALGQEWWQKKPSPEWTSEEVDRMLCASPWVSLSAAQGIRRTVMVPPSWVNVDMGRMGNTSSFPQGLSVPAYYCVRLVTAKPVRDAFLREISLAPDATVGVDDLQSSKEVKSRRMTRAAAIRARDFLIVGDNQHIILAITLRIAEPQPARESSLRRTWTEEARPDELMRLQLSALIDKTVLSTKAGKKLSPTGIDPPGPDLLGAKFYFLRTLPDGSLFATSDDKELRFETQMGNNKIKAKFDLRKMIYDGKLEL